MKDSLKHGAPDSNFLNKREGKKRKIKGERQGKNENEKGHNSKKHVTESSTGGVGVAGNRSFG
jgi:hypothetical protein